MPFTASHPAIILPLLKRGMFSVSGLIMGSMIPDFEFFIRLEAKGPHGHTFWGIFWMNIPVALLCLTLFHVVVRNQLILNLPDYFKKRFEIFLDFNWISYVKGNFFRVIFSILIGNFSHLLWDSFTHFDGFFVTRISFFNIKIGPIPLYHILQYAFSLIGAIAILKFISKMHTYEIKNYKPIKNMMLYWFLVIAIMVLIYIVRYDVDDFKEFGARIVILCAGFLAGLIIISILYKIISSKNNFTLIKE
ncbi:DUF4184 family protein [Aurantibacter crassamenti]|uniref:DUF4184 family protein n=1 Tax=Aurantibacter crassamenti TaxID=1837375 RepID=UPI00193A96B7|nr:DUF4184 family protein [Aurantibacter crassamenti]MBM1105440.1 DUF4184 family protein [Aurantibacter crassamenti]